MDNNNLEKKTEAIQTDDSKISSSTAAMVISPVKNKKPIGFVSHNPLLKNITEYLVEEADAEEEELLGETSGNQSKDANTFEMDKELTKVLDRLILYLRVVHSIDYYNGTEYAQEDFMPNRCGVIHVCDASLSPITEAELTNFMQ
jgi:flagellar basal body rod protein FlgB